MKKASRRKTPLKLVLRGQTVRMLADIDLSNVVGGIETDNVLDTGHVDCPGWPTR
jgi:hypothetical protein